KVCDPVTNKCASSLGACADKGATCKASTECCSLSCVSSKCAAAACTKDGNTCSVDGNCCSGNCVSGSCAPASSIGCATAGNTCAVKGDCCWGLCSGGRCSLEGSYCVQTGDICANDTDCCTATCTKPSGKTIGTCAVAPRGPTNCTAGIDGALCSACN